MFIMFIMH